MKAIELNLRKNNFELNKLLVQFIFNQFNTSLMSESIGFSVGEGDKLSESVILPLLKRQFKLNKSIILIDGLIIFRL